MFFVLYGSVVSECSPGVPSNVQLLRHCPAGVPCSGVPGFIVFPFKGTSKSFVNPRLLEHKFRYQQQSKRSDFEKVQKQSPGGVL